MSRNLQPGIHPDADQLSVFVEGAATAREQERMLAHLAECGECRKAVFLMQPHEEQQPAEISPEKRWAWRGWTWRWLVPVGVSAAALACALIAALIYIRPHGTPETPQQLASVRPPETARSGTTVAPSTNAEADRAAPSSDLEPGAPTDKAGRAPAAKSELVARSGGRQDSFAPSTPAKKVRRQESPIAGGSNLPALKSGQATAGAPSPTAGAAPSVVGGPIGSAQTTDSTLAQSTVSTSATSNLPLNGRNFTQLQQLPAAGTQGAATQDTLAKKKELPALQIQGASGEAQTLAGISGRITDRSGASIAGGTVTVRDTAGKTRQTTTGVDGSFHLTQLPAGQYQLTATASGFKTGNESIELKPSEMAMLQPVLDVGSVSEVVEVEAGATSIQTESANVSDQVAETRGARRGSAALSDRPILATVSQGKRVLSLDDAGNLFLSRDEGKKWKKIKPQWADKAVRIESTTAARGKASANAKDEIGGASEGAVFQLTTDAGTTWSSKDGLHWRQR
ncbi:MAG: carboxypeptidase regulatory-like domain-containing protein [Candidatus Sulfotelmatobacter sp.]